MNIQRIAAIVIIALLLCLTPTDAHAQQIVTSLRSGDWSDIALWSTGALPQAGQAVVINTGQVVTLNVSSTVAGITIQPGAELRFAPSQAVTLSSTANVVINGKLVAKPANATIVHTLRFTGIDETRFVGGGMAVLPNDTGLWVMDGQLDIAGSSKTAWTHAAGSIPFFATQIPLTVAPVDWQVGDTIAIAPTEPLAKAKWAFTHWDMRVITAIDGNVITLDTGVTRGHPINVDPLSGAIYAAEILNLTRNVRIEGTGDGNQLPANNGRAHIFIHSDQPQSIRYMEARYMGPRRTNSDGYTTGVAGRYGLHLHMSGDGSRGTLVEGVVVRDTGNHAFVTHASHGVTLRDTISYNTFDDAYWWDFPTCPTCTSNDTDDLLIDHAVAALVRSDPVFRGFRLMGFVMGAGENLTLRNSVAIGVQGTKEASGFGWPESGHGVWDFSTGNLAHNNAVKGVFVWQNDELHHEIENFTAYNNGDAGVDHGAYTNVYQYSGISSFGNLRDFISRALTNGAIREDGYGMAIEGLRAPGVFVIQEHNVASGIPVLVKDCVVGSILINERDKPIAGKYDFVNCTKPDGTPLQPTDFVIDYARPGSVWRVQNADGTAFRLTGSALATIEPFYILPLSPLAQQVADILEANPSVYQELVVAGIIR